MLVPVHSTAPGISVHFGMAAVMAAGPLVVLSIQMRLAVAGCIRHTVTLPVFDIFVVVTAGFFKNWS